MLPDSWLTTLAIYELLDNPGLEMLPTYCDLFKVNISLCFQTYIFTDDEDPKVEKRLPGKTRQSLDIMHFIAYD